RTYSPHDRGSFAVEFLHLVVQLVHLGVDLFLFDDAFANQESCEAVKQDAVLHDHLLELFVVIATIAFAIDVVHAMRLLPCAGTMYHKTRAESRKQKAEGRRQKA